MKTKWQIGSRLKFIREGIHDSKVAYGFTIGKVYEITDREKYNTPKYTDKNGYKYSVQTDDGQDWWIEPNSFVLAKDPVTEVDFLDCIRDNFSEGF